MSAGSAPGGSYRVFQRLQAASYSRALGPVAPQPAHSTWQGWESPAGFTT